VLPLDLFNVKIYPNPNNGNFVVEFSDYNEKDVSVTNMLGQTVLGAQRATLKSEFDLGQFANGVYFVRIGDVRNADRVEFRQLVIQH